MCLILALCLPLAGVTWALLNNGYDTQGAVCGLMLIAILLWSGWLFISGDPMYKRNEPKTEAENAD